MRTLGLRSDSVATYNFKGQKGPEESRLAIDGVLLQAQEPTLVQILDELHTARVLDVEHEFTTMAKLLEDEGDENEGDDRIPVIPPLCSECKTPLESVQKRYLCACCPSPYYVVCEACEATRATSQHPTYHVFFVVPPTGWSLACHFAVGDLTTWPVYPDAITANEPEVFCDGCNQSLGSGVRFDCAECDDHDLCAKCFANQKSSDPHAGHVWIKIHEPRGCRLVVPDSGALDEFAGDEGDFGEEEPDPTDTRIHLQ
jgi:hypothetical protein